MDNKYTYGLLITLCIILYLSYLRNSVSKLYKLPFNINKNNNNKQLSIYQSFQSKNVSYNIKSVIYENIEMNPEYNYYLYDDYDCRNFIYNNFDLKVLHAFDKLIPGAYKSDLWRYCILYINGGVYIDIKFKIIKPLHTYVKKNTIIFVKDLLGDNVYNAVMIAPPKVELFKHAINEIVNNVNNNYYGDTFLDPTGPGLLGKLIKKHNYTKFITLDMSSYFGLVQIIKDPITNEVYFQSYLLYRYEQMYIQSKKHYINYWIEKNIYYTDDELKKLN
jgi:mannosyltransferase OCH1-like enzyme